ncbi:MAG: hypothetical protein Kow0031_08860 [Anaerolineae bacterium]
MSDETTYSTSSNLQVNASPGAMTQPGSYGNGAQPGFDNAAPRNPRPELEPAPFDKRPLWIGVGVTVTFIVLAIVLGVWLFYHPVAAAVLRDIFMIYIGLGIFVLIPLLILLAVVLIYLALKLNDLTHLIHREVIPMMTTVQNSLNTVNGTTSFLSENAVKPVISTASSYAAARAMVKALFRR